MLVTSLNYMYPSLPQCPEVRLNIISSLESVNKGTCTTIDRGNFTVKIILQLRPTAKT